MKAMLPLAGLALASAAAFLTLSSAGTGQEKAEKDCPMCLETERIKKEYEAGRMPRLEWIDRRLALLEGEYLTNRMGILEERDKALEPEYKAGKVRLDQILDAKLEIAWLKYSLEKSGEEEFKKRRSELVDAYRNWLKEQQAAGKIGKEEFEDRLKRLEEEP